VRNTGPTERIQVTLPADVLAQLDAAKANRTRSKTIADMIVAYLNRRKNPRSDEAAKSLRGATGEYGE
jgi:metal-responsive CopG/Arc/MetJ family transcriptional regulator